MRMTHNHSVHMRRDLLGVLQSALSESDAADGANIHVQEKQTASSSRALSGSNLPNVHEEDWTNTNHEYQHEDP